MGRKKESLKKWAKEHMKGIENTLFPSFTPDMSRLDEEGIRLDVRQSIAHGFFSMMCATETGLTLDEAKRFVEIAADEAGGKIVVTTSLILNSFDENMALMEHAEKAGVNGVLLGYPPAFHPREKEAVYEASKRFCDATDMHVTLYPSPHFPFGKFHNSGFPLDVMARLAELPNVVAVKIGEMGLFADVQRMIGDQVLVGCPVERFVPLLVKGFGMQWMGAGCYEVLQSPEKPYLVEYFNLLQEGKDDAAMEIYWKIAPMRNIFEMQFNQTVMTGTYNWHQQKFYQWCTGGNGGLTRQPAMKLHQWEIDPIKLGYFLIGITPPENDEEFFAGKMNCRRMQNRGENRSAHSRAETLAAGKGKPGDSSAGDLLKALLGILDETEEEIGQIPKMIRPVVKSGFKKQTGKTLEQWRQSSEAVAAALASGKPDSAELHALKTSLVHLAEYYQKAPEESKRFVKNKDELERLSAKMGRRTETVASLIAALDDE